MTTIASKFAEPFDATRITRPERVLMWYYLLVALLTVVGFPFVILPLFFRYETLRYRFDSEGVSMSWGILFRREIYLTYRRIQDIHLTRNILQRWMGLATVSVQTASGSATPEMSIEGILQADQLRDFLYAQMRGARHEHDDPVAGETPAAMREAAAVGGGADEAVTLLREIRDTLQQVSLARRNL